MYTDSRISAALEIMVMGINAPPVPLPDIYRKIVKPQAVVTSTSRTLRLATAVAGMVAAILVIFSAYSLGFIQNIEQDIEARYRAILHTMGGYAPPPVPESQRQALLKQAVSSQNATLAAAQARVIFTIVPPAGLPHDVVSAKIRTAPTGVYSTVTHSWRMGPSTVTFVYQRAGGRSFELLADRFDPRSGPESKYIIEAREATPDGRPVVVKHEKFAWRNGSQIMTAIEGEGISSLEIEAIRVAMRGVAVPRRWPNPPSPGTPLKLYPYTGH